MRPKGRRRISPAKAPATVPPALEGVWAPTDTSLDHVELLDLPSGHGPEDVCVDLEGRLISGGEDGRIWRWSQRNGTPELIAETGGRPLGIEVDPRDGTLIVCDAYRGLLRLTDRGLEDLTSTAGGTPILFCNNAAVSADGTVFFTDSSNRYPLSVWKRDLLEHKPNGRLLSYRDGVTEVIATGLYFPNGVALTPAEDQLLLLEDSTHRLLRFDLSTGERTELLDLPAYPDNMSAVGDGTFWIALPSPRLPIMEKLLPYPSLRRIAALLPERLQPQPLKYGLAAQVDIDGNVLRTLHGPSGRYCMVTGVRQQGDVLWLGSLTERSVARVML